MSRRLFNVLDEREGETLESESVASSRRAPTFPAYCLRVFINIVLAVQCGVKEICHASKSAMPPFVSLTFTTRDFGDVGSLRSGLGGGFIGLACSIS